MIDNNIQVKVAMIEIYLDTLLSHKTHMNKKYLVWMHSVISVAVL
jgi:hypothetical protein